MSACATVTSNGLEMKCPECKRTDGITAMREPIMRAYDVQFYQMECSCGHVWERHRGMRYRPSPESRQEWLNVEYVENRFERRERERREKVDRGECPQCGGRLTIVVDENASSERLARSETKCDGCDYRLQSSMLLSTTEKEGGGNG